VEWKYLLPLLVKCGLVRSKVTSVVKDVIVGHGQWDELAKAITRAVRMEITSVHTRFSRRSYFFCIGPPKFRSPLEQERALMGISKEKQEELFTLALQPPPRQLVLDVQAVATGIRDERLANRVLRNTAIQQAHQEEPQQQEPHQQEGVVVQAWTPNDNQVPVVANDDQVEVVATAVHAAIEFAAALDLERRPRLSRTTAGKWLTKAPFSKRLWLFSNTFVLFI
jgi:hypothetical protein